MKVTPIVAQRSETIHRDGGKTIARRFYEAASTLIVWHTRETSNGEAIDVLWDDVHESCLELADLLEDYKRKRFSAGLDEDERTLFTAIRDGLVEHVKNARLLDIKMWGEERGLFVCLKRLTEDPASISMSDRDNLVAFLRLVRNGIRNKIYKTANTRFR